MNVKHTKRFGIYTLGLISLAFGVILNTKSNLGVSPVTLIPYFITYITRLPIGTSIFFFNMVYFIMELVRMYKKRSNPCIFLHILFSLAFGWFSNLFSHFITLNPKALTLQLITLLFAIFFTCLGVIMMITMDLVASPPDALVNEMSITFRKDYGLCKNILDAVCVFLIIILCLSVTHKIVSIEIGTVSCMIINGRVMYLLNRVLKPTFDNIRLAAVNKASES